MIRDKNVRWNRKFVLYRPDFQNYKNVAASDVFVPADGLAADILTEVTGMDVFAPLVTAAGALDTGSSQVVGPVEIPYDLDPTKTVGVGVVWTHDGTGSTNLATTTWAVTYNAVNFGANIYNSAGGSGATFKIAEPTTALDTTITAQTNFTFANSLELCVSPRGVIAANKLLSTTGIWSFRARLSAATASFDTKVWYLGLLVDYSVRKTKGPGMTTDSGVPQNWLDTSPSPATGGA